MCVLFVPVPDVRFGTDDRVGFSDPIYAEAYVKVHGFDILLGKSLWANLSARRSNWGIFLCVDVLLVNQTADTLQNLCLDFATLGDLKLVERPSTYTIAPHSFQSIKATIKVCTANINHAPKLIDHVARFPQQKPASSLAAYCGKALGCRSSV